MNYEEKGHMLKNVFNRFQRCPVRVVESNGHLLHRGRVCNYVDQPKILNVANNGWNYKTLYSSIAAVEVNADPVIGIKVVMKPLSEIT